MGGGHFELEVLESGMQKLWNGVWNVGDRKAMYGLLKVESDCIYIHICKLEGSR